LGFAVFAGCVLKSIKKVEKEQKSMKKHGYVEKRVKKYKKGSH
jgi:hypothetical protein